MCSLISYGYAVGGSGGTLVVDCQRPGFAQVRKVRRIFCRESRDAGTRFSYLYLEEYMRQFSAFLQRIVITTVVFGVLVLGALGVVGWISYLSHHQAKEFRDGWHVIHETKDELLMMQQEDLADWDLIEENLAVISETLEGLPDIGVTFDPESVLALRGASDEEVLAEYSRLQELEEVMQTQFFETQEAQGQMLAVTFLLQGVLIAGVVVAFTYFRRYNRDYQVTLTDSVMRLHDIVQYRSEPRPLPQVRWEEEAETLRAIETVASQVLADRRISEMGSGDSLEQLVEQLYDLLSGSVPCDRVAMAFLDPIGNVIAESAFTVMDRVYLDPGFTERLENTTLGRVAEQRTPRIINDLQYHYDYVHSSRPTEWLLREGLRANITMPIILGDECIGFLFVTSRDANVYTQEHADFLAHVTNLLGDKLYSSYKVQQLIAKTAEGFVTLTREKDNETSNHIVRMSRYSYLIAKQLFSYGHSITPRFMREILWFAPLHDIGKIGIPDDVLTKPGALNESEWNQMKQHVSIGENVIGSMNRGLKGAIAQGILDTGFEIVSTHHERWDGNGYPRGLVGEAIPLAGRIVAVADVFDALTSRRPYKPAFSVERALNILREERGKHFDPEVLRAFFDVLPSVESVRAAFSDED